MRSSPVDPAKGARIGGMIAMGCSGTNAYRYGTMKQHVLSLTLVLADGTVVKTRNRPRKSSAGYDLTNLVVGSEGTLALVTEAILKITPLPKNPQVGLAVFEKMEDGVAVAIGIMKSGVQLEALELVDGDCMHCINHSKLASSTFLEQPTLFLKFAGSEQAVQEQVEFVQGLCEKHGVKKSEFTKEKKRMDAIWDGRKCLGNALAMMKKQASDLVITTDAAVPVSKLAQLVEGSRKIVEEQAGEQGWWCGSVGHVGDGNVHTAIVCPKEAKEDVEELVAKIQKLALELEGTITGEHGIGLKLRDMLNEEVGTEGVDAMRRIKFSLDPKGILNPDKVVRLEGGI
jgi:D-lactate dehydrogenase (cytochrome)